MIKVGIIGATAYTSREIIKILLRHPDVDISYLGTRREGNFKISEIFPVLEDTLDMPCSQMVLDDLPNGLDMVFVTLPPVVAMQYVPMFLNAGIR
ncbi:MAG: N-acetyl-gamma-glutamyl-phosphate reductase [Candidatus Scalindua brodae]|uniref:N-acetyl-gamma-glutamyl-phosphate reductase n=1 Tax=Candidatus Scalindua brodae TaxID=237368 RepID=A0A0B0EK27_9BACT|nr:MAG: N-acetyl-gamma-glutamyl-phosphate reductase [Candidatus Scalindua brodae]